METLQYNGQAGAKNAFAYTTEVVRDRIASGVHNRARKGAAHIAASGCRYMGTGCASVDPSESSVFEGRPVCSGAAPLYARSIYDKGAAAAKGISLGFCCVFCNIAAV